MLQRPVELAQYTSIRFGEALLLEGLAASVGSVGDCYDNALCESFFATLEHELLATTPAFPSHHAARQAIFEFIEVWYNRQRLHSSLGYRSPAAFEEHLNVA